jgi:hypothetical protein
MRSLFLSLILVPLVVCAQQRESDRLRAEADTEKAELFRQLDTDRDGTLSRAELAAPAAQRGNWIAADRNGDNRISPSEFALVRPLRATTAVGSTRPPADEQAPATGAGRP